MKLHDWVIHDYKIKQITRVEDGMIREVSCGSFSCSSTDLTPSCRPLTLTSKRMAECFDHYYDQLRNTHGSNALNWPDIHRYLCGLCLKAIDSPKRKYAEGELNPFVAEGQEFVRKTKDALEGMPDVNGVRLFRR